MQTCRVSIGDVDRSNSPLPDLSTLRHSGNHNKIDFMARLRDFYIAYSVRAAIHLSLGLFADVFVVVTHASRYYV